MSLNWSYDDENRVTSLVVKAPTGASSVATRAYDKDNYLARNGWVSYERSDAMGRITQKHIDNATIKREYDSSYGDLVKIEYDQGTQTKLQRNYKRDRLGRISYESSGAIGDYLLYDESGRYIGREPRGAKEPAYQYKYDANGNRVWTKTPDGEVTATYDDQDRLITWGNIDFGYNKNGERVSKTDGAMSTYYSYDSFGNLKEVDLPNSDVITYQLDGLNRRVTRSKNGTRTDRYIYSDQLKIVADLDANNQIEKRFVYGDDVNVPDYMVYKGTRYLFVKDVRGSVLEVVNSQTGEVAQELAYDDWGKVTKDTNPGFQPFGFAGGVYDSDTGLVHFGARDYDGGVGRWLTRDPLKFDGGDSSLYGYVLQDPVSRIDTTGLAQDSNGPNGPGGSYKECFDTFSRALRQCGEMQGCEEKKRCNERAEREFIECEKRMRYRDDILPMDSYPMPNILPMPDGPIPIEFPIPL